MKHSFFLLVYVFVMVNGMLAQNSSTRSKYNFNSAWKVFIGDP
ncbi:MAG: hypothetical protein JWP81_5023 [Ferruginibacter sp.]|nr:hypothetical protein [Ferruginibacter sp.]